MRFDYIIDKIRNAEFATEPFKHLHIPDLFTPEDFREIVAAQEISLGSQASDEALFEAMFASGYKIIEFPGCITDRDAYLRWHKNKQPGAKFVHSACEGFGVVLRLMEARSQVINELMQFLNSAEFQQAIGDRYGVDTSGLVYDAGIQKYLDGYEISPHPDIRKKALTFLVNINPAPDSERYDHHTHYMRFVEERKYVRDFWERAGFADRCWVPWAWCETAKTQPENNSMVLFSPSNDTLHAVKAEYDHLRGQRTQLYGNLWYKNKPKMVQVEWEELAKGDLDAIKPPRATIKDVARAVLPSSVRDALSSVAGSGRNKPNADSFHSRKY